MEIRGNLIVDRSPSGIVSLRLPVGTLIQVPEIEIDTLIAALQSLRPAPNEDDGSDEHSGLYDVY